jgi:hypothetical protein
MTYSPSVATCPAYERSDKGICAAIADGRPEQWGVNSDCSRVLIEARGRFSDGSARASAHTASQKSRSFECSGEDRPTKGPGTTWIKTYNKQSVSRRTKLNMQRHASVSQTWPCNINANPLAIGLSIKASCG